MVATIHMALVKIMNMTVNMNVLAFQSSACCQITAEGDEVKRSRGVAWYGLALELMVVCGEAVAVASAREIAFPLRVFLWALDMGPFDLVGSVLWALFCFWYITDTYLCPN